MQYNGGNSYLFVNGTEICKFKAKDSGISPNSLCLGNMSKDWSTDNIKKQGLLAIFMILVQITMLLQLMILKTFINI